MSRFTKYTPQAHAYINKRIEEFENGQMTLDEDKIQLFQDICDLNLSKELNLYAQQYLKILVENALVIPFSHWKKVA